VRADSAPEHFLYRVENGVDRRFLHVQRLDPVIALEFIVDPVTIHKGDAGRSFSFRRRLAGQGLAHVVDPDR